MFQVKHHVILDFMLQRFCFFFLFGVLLLVFFMIGAARSLRLTSLFFIISMVDWTSKAKYHNYIEVIVYSLTVKITCYMMLIANHLSSQPNSSPWTTLQAQFPIPLLAFNAWTVTTYYIHLTQLFLLYMLGLLLDTDFTKLGINSFLTHEKTNQIAD